MTNTSKLSSLWRGELQTSDIQKVIWSIDPFEKPDSLRQNAIRVLATLSEKRSDIIIEIEPVFVLRPQIDLAFDFEGALFRELESEAIFILGEIRRKYQLPLTEPHIIITPRSSQAAAVNEVCTYARESGASFILANTHARSGVKRLFLGSFAESLLLHSQIPVLTVNPNARKIRPFNHILFPTDFARESHHTFQEAVKLAQKLSAKITLVHAIPYPIEPYYRGNLFYQSRYEAMVCDFVEKQRQDAERQAKGWKRWARTLGVKVDPIIISQGGGVAEHIIKIARQRRVSVIAMETRKGPAESAILGSVTRQVTRSAPCPVWIIHSRYAEHEQLPKPEQEAA